MTDHLDAKRVPVPTQLCYHTNLLMGPKPPAQMVGSCGHNYGCPVCGFGVGQSPDPCYPNTRAVSQSDAGSGKP